MKSKNKTIGQLGFLAPSLREQLNPKQEPYLLSGAIDWAYFDRGVGSLCRAGPSCPSDTDDGRSSDPQVFV